MAGAGRTLLLLTRHYPPVVSGGARRPFLLARGLRARGWRVIVVSPEAPEDEPDWVEVSHYAARPAQESAGDGPAPAEPGWRTALRRLVYWPDNDVRWAHAAARAVLARGVKPDWILTTSPPESLHLAGRRLQRRLGARWAGEMRDSWIEAPLREELARSRLRRWGERFILRRTLGQADRIVAVSPSIGEEARRQIGRTGVPLAVIGHFADTPPAPYAFEGEGPHFVHSGSFSLSHPDRRIEKVLSAFAEVLRDLPQARLHLAGPLSAQERTAIAHSPAAGAVIDHGAQAYDIARAMQAGADGLVLYQPAIDSLPGKLAEYLAATAAIFTVGDGPWKARLEPVPSWPLAEAAEALAAPRREPIDSYQAALNAYETLLMAEVSGKTR